MLGADPEFIIAQEGLVQDANTVFRRYSVTAQIGCDGAPTTGELRPRPAEDPEVLFSNVETLIARLGRQYPTYQFYAGSCPFNKPTGGHLHFSDVVPTRELIAKLDAYIATPLNEISDASDRHYWGYGALSETRGQPWGWEYRAPCSWLSHPVVARGVLEIAGTLSKRSYEVDGREALVACAAHPEAVEAFYRFVDERKTSGEKLESIEILTAWGKRDISTRSARRSNTPGTLRNPQTIEWSEDANLDVVRRDFEAHRRGAIRRFTDAPVRVCGVSRERTVVYSVFLSPDLYRLANYRDSNVRGIRVYSANFLPTNTVGLTWNLRRLSPAAGVRLYQVLNRIVWYNRSVARGS